MKRTKKLMILFATLFLLMSAAVFANTYSAGNGGKVMPYGWCRVHGHVQQQLVNERLVCSLCDW